MTQKNALSIKTRFLNVLRKPLQIPLIEEKVADWTSSHSRASWLYKMLPNHYQYPSHSFRRVQRNGLYYELDIGDFLDWHIYYGLEEGDKKTLYSLAREGDVVFDVGANIGETSMRLASVVGEKGAVYAFEPDPSNYSKLLANLSLNSFQQLFDIPFALSDEEKEYYMSNVSERNPAGKRIRSKGEPDGSSKVKAVTMDSFVQKKNIEKVSLIKIDVEGFEMRVLQGAKKVISQHRPTLFIELDDSNLKEQQSSAKELILFLEDLSYRIIRSDTGSAVTSLTDFSRSHYDVICTPK